MLDRFAHLIIRFRWWVMFVYVAVSVFLLYHASGIGFSYTFKQFFPENNAIVDIYEQMASDFGEDDTALLIAFEGERVFTPEVLKAYADYHEKLAHLDGIVEVDSIINALRPTLEDDTLSITELFDPVPDDPSIIAERKRYLVDSELYRGSTISNDGNAILLVARIDPARNNGQDRKPVLDAVEALNRELAAGTGQFVKLGGVPFSRTGYTELMTMETAKMTGGAGLVILIILILTFRHWAGVLFSLVIVILATLAPIGTMALLDIKISLMSTVLPVIVMITGVANSIHFHTRYYEELKRGRDRTTAIVETTRHLAVALFITSVTTSIGFSILATTDIKILGDFGLFTGLGVVASYLITITFLPAVLAIIPPPPRHLLERFFSGGSKRFLEFVEHATTRHRVVSVGICLIIGLTSAYYATTMERKQKIQDDLDDDHPIIETLHYFENKLGGVLPMDVLIDTGTQNGVKEPEAMHFAEAVKNRLEGFEEIKKVYSPSTFIQEIAITLNPDDPAAAQVPDSRAAIAQYLLLYDMNVDNPLDDLITPRSDRMRVSSRIDDVYSPRAREVFTEIETWLNDHTPAGIKSHLTGLSPVAHVINTYVVNEIFFTFLWALGIITLLLIVQFRSWRLGLLSLIPNFFPLATILGMIGALDINLKPSSAITFSIALGIAVDDTVHYITRFIQEYQQHHDPERAARRAIYGTGKAMVFTTIVLVSGFLVPVLMSQVRANHEFGILSVGAISMALLADLFVLPVILPLLFRSSASAKSPILPLADKENTEQI